MVEWIYKGDIFNIKNIDNYAHGCNCAGAMGKGIALQFKKKYPEMYDLYKKKCRKGEFVLGDVFIYPHRSGYIFNLATQTSWKSKAEIHAIETSLVDMMNFATKNNVQEIAMPRIGSGLGGLDWKEVRKLILRIAKKFPCVRLYVVENYSPAPQ